ncbi:PaaI family thioesterase [Nocardia sp. alder85J]|uniref:PaaI family thioesterase n=1 Tax=Nocardia sp. alder85J TaxID=2862949 RepID=UPI001CD3DDEA|nr:PaaI family thioesterase [Nocardia sp. alder85J]MCX4096466.1 PaaI family thioesterase [Nocardia sp. alder85J]
MTATFDLELARAVLAAQPFSALLGAEISSFGDGSATLEIPIRPELGQQFGFLHGGVLAYAADNALTFAAGTVLGPNVLTGGFSINYLRPGSGVRLRAQARVVGSTRRQAACSCEIYTEDAAGTAALCAVAQGTVRAVDSERTGA